MAGGSGENSRLNETQRQQLINNTETLERTSRKLEDTHRLTVETEEVNDNANTLKELALLFFFRLAPAFCAISPISVRHYSARAIA